jgi:hypothetical protein
MSLNDLNRMLAEDSVEQSPDVDYDEIDPNFSARVRMSHYIAQEHGLEPRAVFDGYKDIAPSYGYTDNALYDLIGEQARISQQEEYEDPSFFGSQINSVQRGGIRVAQTGDILSMINYHQTMQNYETLAERSRMQADSFRNDPKKIEELDFEAKRRKDAPLGFLWPDAKSSQEVISSFDAQARNAAKAANKMRILRDEQAVEAAIRQAKVLSIPMSKKLREFKSEDGKLTALLNPATFSELLLEEFIASSPAIAAAVGGRIAGGPVGGEVGSGIVTYAQGVGNNFFAYLSQNDVDTSNPEAITKALEDKDLYNAAMEYAFTKSAPAAIAAALSMKVAGKGNPILNALFVQTGLAGAGSAASSLIVGEDIDIKDLLVEMAAELPGGSIEVGSSIEVISSRLSSGSDKFKKLTQSGDIPPKGHDLKMMAKAESMESLTAGMNKEEATLVEKSANGDKRADKAIQRVAAVQKTVEKTGIEIGEPKGERESVFLKQNEIDLAVEELNLETLPDADRVSFQEQLETAKREGLIEKAEQIARSVNKKPRALSAPEQAALNFKAAQLKKEYRQLIQKSSEAAESGDSDLNASLNEEASDVLERFEDVLRAGKLAGTEMGRALAQRRVGNNIEDFSLVSMISQAQAFKGEKLTGLEVDLFKRLTNEIEKNRLEIRRLESQMAGLFDKDATPEQKKQLLEAYIKDQQSKRKARKKVDAYRKRGKIELAIEIAGLPRALISTADMGASLRQGLLLSVSRPGAALDTFGKAFKAFFSQNKADEIDLVIRKHPDHYKRERAKLYLTPMDRIHMAAREETFVSTFAERIPLIKHLVLASERHMVATLNMLRVAAFDQFMNSHPESSLGDQKAFADYVNKASGRGDLGRAAGAAQAASIVFFAPRFAISRFQAPLTLAKNWKSPVVRNAIAKDFALFLGTGGTMLGLAALAGFEVGYDPKDSDFGKIKIKNTRIDIWGSFLQPARLVLQPIMAGKDRWQEGETDVDLIQAAMQFASYKLNPSITIPAQLITGEDLIGEERTMLQTLGNSTVPLIVQETIDTLQTEKDPALAAGSFGGAFFGVGVSSYEKGSKKSSNKRKTIFD